ELRIPLDAEGRFTFREVPAGVTLTVWVGPNSDGANLYCLTQDLVLKPGERREVEYVVRLGNVIRGRVVTAEGDPVPDARVAVLPPAADWRATAVRVATMTDDEGLFYVGVRNFESAGPRRLVVDAVDRGYILEELLIEPPEMEMGQEIRVRLTMGLAIAGRAFGPDGAPLAGATVHLLEDYDGDLNVRRPVEGRVRTDVTGKFRDDAYRPGVYRVFLEGETKAGPVALVRDGIRAGDENVRLRVGECGSLELAFVSDVTGEPVVPSEASLEFVWGHTGEEEYYAPWSDLEGKARHVLTSLPPGHYRVGAHHPGYESLFSDLLPVEAGDRAKITFRLKPR
ncbi:MAG: carboxypeptidase-like regulatory domain-containing protein, partial [Planctomycetota bacterium]